MILNYDVMTQEYYESVNNAQLKISLIEECVQKPDNLWSVNFTHWYTLIVSYVIPSLVLVVCYIRIISFMTRKNSSLGKISVK